MKVDIIVRACGNETAENLKPTRPSWFDKRRCYRSVWNMTDQDPATFAIHVIYDGETSPLLDYIQSMRMAHDGLRKVNVGGYGTIQVAYEYADSLTGDWIYFVEDDYLHSSDAARVFLEGANRFELFTLYDHLDRYHRTDDITAGQESVALTASCHWRTAESTCCTYVISRNLWNEFHGLIKQRGPNDRHLFQDLVKEGIRLWTPIPGRSTHCFEGYMSPLVNWEKVAIETVI